MSPAVSTGLRFSNQFLGVRERETKKSFPEDGHLSRCFVCFVIARLSDRLGLVGKMFPWRSWLWSPSIMGVGCLGPLIKLGLPLSNLWRDVAYHSPPCHSSFPKEPWEVMTAWVHSGQAFLILLRRPVSTSESDSTPLIQVSHCVRRPSQGIPGYTKTCLRGGGRYQVGMHRRKEEASNFNLYAIGTSKKALEGAMELPEELVVSILLPSLHCIF